MHSASFTPSFTFGAPLEPSVATRISLPPSQALHRWVYPFGSPPSLTIPPVLTRPPRRWLLPCSREPYAAENLVAGLLSEIRQHVAARGAHHAAVPSAGRHQQYGNPRGNGQPAYCIRRHVGDRQRTSLLRAGDEFAPASLRDLGRGIRTATLLQGA